MDTIKSTLLHLQKRHRLVIGVFLLVFGIRSIYALFVQLMFGAQAFSAFNDSANYILIAQNLLDHGAFSIMKSAPWLPDALRTPLYVFILTGFLWAKIPLAVLIYLQNVLAGIAGVLILKIGRMLFKSSSIGFLAAFFFALEPMSVYWSGLLMPDNVFLFLVTLSLYLFVKERWFWFAFVMGLATLGRPVALYFFPLFLLWHTYAVYARSRLGIIQWLKRALVAIIIFLAAISPWVVRNKVVYDMVEFSSAGWYNSQFSAGRFAAANDIPYPRRPFEAYEYPEGVDRNWVTEFVLDMDFRSAEWRKQQFIDIITEHPFSYALYHAQSMLRSLVEHDYEYLFTYVVQDKFPNIPTETGTALILLGNALWLFLYAFGLFGLLFREHRMWKVCLLIFILWNSFLVGIAGGSWGGRYNLPATPAMFLLAAWGMHAWYSVMKTFYVRNKWL